MKLKRICYVVIMVLLLCLFFTGCQKQSKEETITFNLNFETEIFKAQVDKEYISTRIYEENILLFEPVLENESSYMSVLATTNTSTDEECKQMLLDYKTSLEAKGYKTSLINESTTNGVSFLTYTIVASNGDIVTVYSKASSNNDYTVKATLFQAYSEKAETNIALKNAFDSLILNTKESYEKSESTVLMPEIEEKTESKEIPKVD